VPQDDWPARSILAAHEEQYPGKYTQCKNEIKDFSYSLWSPEFETAFPPEGATRQQVINAIQAGVGIVNYRGHGDNYEWSWAPGFYNSDCHALQNGLRLFHVFNICCNNMWLDDPQEVIGEAFHNAGSNGENGAVTSLGASRPSYTDPNHIFDKWLYRATYDEGSPPSAT
jgi:hypothetical protein